MHILIHYREIVLGETIVGEDPDCWGRGSPSKCLTGIIKRYISKIIVHDDYSEAPNKREYTGLPDTQNDIALIRVDRPIPLFSKDSSLSSIIPICLPWLENDPGRNLAEGELLMFTGKVIIEKSSGGRFLWNRNLDLGWIWAKWSTFLPS